MSSPSQPAPWTPEEVARRVEHAVLAPEAGEADVAAACVLARASALRAVVAKPVHVALARRLLEGSGVRVVAVVGFPHGGSLAAIKAAEARAAIRDGADEVDMVIDLGALRDGRDDLIRDEIRAVVAAAGGHPVKVILEAALLSEAQKVRACQLAMEAGAAYVKTSTGFARGGATVDDVALLRRTVGRALGVKAAGGIRTWADAVALLEAGADLLGTSHTQAILAEARRAA
jgi:deoxyribose-phosphate aldolase